jgi:hypothetical protein
VGVLTWLLLASYKNQSWVDNFSSGIEGSGHKGFLRQESVLSHPSFIPSLDGDFATGKKLQKGWP